MKRVVLIDGAHHPSGEPAVHVFNRAFLYGESAFETLRTYHRRPYLLLEHLMRLEKSLACLEAQLPVPREVLSNEVERSIALLDGDEHIVRIIVSQVNDGLGLAARHVTSMQRVVIAETLEKSLHCFLENGISAMFVHRTPFLFTASVKLGSYAENTVALRKAHANNVDDVIFVSQSRVLEACFSNVFAVTKDVLQTPMADGTILNGITRQRVLQLARKQGIKTDEAELTVDALLRANEVFLTSSVREIVPVVKIDDHVIGAGAPGPVTKRILEMYRQDAMASGS